LGYLNPPCRRRRARSGFGEKMEKKLEDCLAALREVAEESVSSSKGGGGSYDSDNLSLFMSNLFDICKELVGSSEEHTSFAIAILFDEEIGVFSILECIMRICDKSVAKAREDCLKFVEAFVKQIGGRVLPHATFMKVSE
jgi:predicted hydrolase (HD superfamily)